MANATGPAPAVPENPAQAAPMRLFWPSPKTVRHVLIEVLIVTIGVLLALGIDQLRQHFGRLGQAQETRELLRAEMQRNSAALQEGMKGVAEVYRQIDAAPEDSVDPMYVMEKAVRIPPLVNAAYTVALQTGALAYLDPRERTTLAEAYRVQENHDQRAAEYFAEYRELAAYRVGKMDDAQEVRERSRQIRRVQMAARSLFGVQCRQMVRIRTVLAESREDRSPREYCLGLDLRTVDIDALIAGKREPAPPIVPEPTTPN